MLSRTVRVQVVIFVVASLVAISYMSVRYVGVLRMLGQSGYDVQVELADSGGIFTNAEVDYRGVPVGRVGAMKLTATGIEVTLKINSARNIPSDVEAVVANRSVIGEQYVDLQPKTNSGPYLKDGSRIPQSATQLPPPLSTLLLSSNQFLQSIPIHSLQTTVNELYLANQNLGPNLQRLLTTSQAFFTTATQNLPTTIDLINAGKTVLATQQQEAGAITTFSANLKLFNQQLAASDGDIRRVIYTTPAAAAQLSGPDHRPEQLAQLAGDQPAHDHQRVLGLRAGPQADLGEPAGRAVHRGLGRDPQRGERRLGADLLRSVAVHRRIPEHAGPFRPGHLRWGAVQHERQLHVSGVDRHRRARQPERALRKLGDG